MQAIVYDRYGPPEVLHLQEVPTPRPKANEVLVKVLASPVNFGDTLARAFNRTSPRNFTMPAPLWLLSRIAIGWSKPRRKILGSEFAGDIAEVGAEVTQFKPGDAVFGYRAMSFGAYAEYLTMPASGAIALKPATLSYEEAATVPYGALTASNLLRKVEIKPGHRVLINGASGAIGSYAIQLAKHFGAEVTGVCGTPRLDFVRALGADHVIDYTREDFTQNGESYDLVFDVLGKSSWARVKGSLTPNGRYLLASFKLKQLGQMLLTARSSRQRVICALSSESQDDLVAIKELVEAGAITTVIDRRFPLARAADAHRYVEDGQKRGHVVLTMAHE